MINIEEIKGVVVPIVSPFDAEGTIDVSAVKRIINYLSDAGVSAFIQGTTGEALSIPTRERLRFAEAAVQANRKERLLYAGISHHSFEDSVALASRFYELGINVAVAHLPTFYPLNNKEITTYFERLADAIDLPLLIYNIPQAVGMSIPVEVVEKLSLHANIYGIKDSENDLSRLKVLVDLSKKKDDFCHLTGCASLSLNALSIGSDGIVPSAGNIVPHLYKQLYEATLQGDMKEAQKLQRDTGIISTIYQTNKSLPQSLTALKIIMKHFNLCEPYVLLPLLPFTSEEESEIISRIDSCMELRQSKQIKI